MSLYNRIGLLTIAITLGCNWSVLISKVNAQGLGNAPYSSLGMGELYTDAFAASSGMGQANVSSSSGFEINNLNPALWVRNKFTTLDFGIVGQYKGIVSGNNKQTNSGGNLAYVALAFPVAPRWTLGISIKPYSFVDYANTEYRNIAGTPNYANYYQTGKGGINKASFTNAVQIGKYLSLGVEASYFFGNVRTASEAMINSGRGSDYLVSISNRLVYNDIAFRGGAALKLPIKKNNKLNLNLGGTYSLGTKLNAQKTTAFELTQNSFPVVTPDTLVNNQKGTTTLPVQYQVGFSFEWPYKLILAADYSHESWSGYKNFERSNGNDGLKDVDRLHVGVEYTPKFGSLSYLNNVRYRLGVSTGNSPYVINEKNIKDNNVSLGFTLPMGRGYQNFISLSFIGGQRGVVGTGVVRERYGRVVLGLTLRERWFEKQKID
jgi:hypothetical protein